MSLAVYTCRMINCDMRFFSARALIYHMTLSHHEQCLDGFSCNIDGCNNMYRTVSAYRMHLLRNHINHWNALSLTLDSPETTQDPVEINFGRRYDKWR